MKECVNLRVVLALQLIDTVTGTSCERFSFRVTHPEFLNVQWKKQGGYLVFSGARERFTGQIRLTSPEYADVSLSLPEDPAVLPEKVVRPCLLYPRRRYRPPRAMPCVEGRTAPFALVKAVQTEERTKMVLGRDLQPQDTEITIFSEDGRGPSAVCLSRGSAEHWAVLIRQPGDPERYLLAQPAGEAFPRKDSRLRRAFLTRADENGDFTLFLPGLEPGCRQITLFLEQEGQPPAALPCPVEQDRRTVWKQP